MGLVMHGLHCGLPVVKVCNVYDCTLFILAVHSLMSTWTTYGHKNVFQTLQTDKINHRLGHGYLMFGTDQVKVPHVHSNKMEQKKEADALLL